MRVAQAIKVDPGFAFNIGFDNKYVQLAINNIYLDPNKKL